MDMYNSGSIASVLDQQKVRMHTDGYKAILTSKFSVDLTTYSTNVNFYNCIGSIDDDNNATTIGVDGAVGTAGAYCLWANS